MKWFMIFSVGIVVIFSVFFAGMYIDSSNEPTATGSIVIKAKPELVWKWVTEPRKVTRWIQRMKSSKRLSQNDLIVGSLYNEKTNGPGGTTYRWDAQVELLEAPKRFVLVSKMRTRKGKFDDEPTPVSPETSRISDIRSSYTLTPVEGGTRVDKSVTTGFKPWYMAWFSNVAVHRGNEAIASDLERLKTKIESEEESRLKKLEKKKKKEADKKKKKDARKKKDKEKKDQKKNGQKKDKEKSEFELLSPNPNLKKRTLSPKPGLIPNIKDKLTIQPRPAKPVVNDP